MMHLVVIEHLRLSFIPKALYTALLLIIPSLSVVFLVTYPQTRLMYGQIWLDQSGIFPMFQKTNGPFYWINQIYLVLLIVGGIFAEIKYSLQSSALARKQAAIISAGLFLIIATDIIYLAGLRPWGVINLSMFSYFPAGLIIFFGTQRYHLANIRPIARGILLDQMREGMLVIDHQNHLDEINLAGRKLLNIEKEPIGESLASIAPKLSIILENNSINLKSSTVFIHVHGIFIEVNISPIVINQRDKAGTLLILRDIGDQLAAEHLRETELKLEISRDERKNIARTLHDSINQYLNSLILLSGTAKQRLEQGKHEQLLPVILHIEASARKAVEEMRDLIHELQLESNSDRGFDLVKSTLERTELINSQSNIKINLEVLHSLSLDSRIQREVFFILIEGLNNILQHAGADSVDIRIDQIAGLFTVEMADNGCGFVPDKAPKGGMGLINMRERTRNLGGIFRLESAPGSGTLIHFELAIDSAPERGVHT